jgi:hypothetical protein
VGWGGWGGENSSSKAFGISFADRPKAKKALHVAYHLFITVRQVSLFTVRGERPLQRHVQLAWRLGGLRLLAILDMHSRPQCR